MHHHRTDSKLYVAEAGREDRKALIDYQHEQRADEQETVDREKALEVLPLHAVENGRGLHQVAIARPHQQQRQDQARPLRDQRTHCHAVDPQGRIECQQPAGQHVDQIDPQVGNHRKHRILHADEPSLEDKQRQGGGRRPNPDEKVIAGNLFHFRRGVHQQEHQLRESPLDGQHDHRDHQGSGNALRESADRGLHVAPSVGLGRYAARSHPQEAHVPIEQVEEHRADGNAADQHGVAQVAGDGRIDDADQRHRDVGQDARHGKTDHFTVDGIAPRHVTGISFLLPASRDTNCSVRGQGCRLPAPLSRHSPARGCGCKA